MPSSKPKAGGLYRSDDAGATWRLVNANRDLWQRAFYFNRVVADPRDADTVYVLNFIVREVHRRRRDLSLHRDAAR